MLFLISAQQYIYNTLSGPLMIDSMPVSAFLQGLRDNIYPLSVVLCVSMSQLKLCKFGKYFCSPIIKQQLKTEFLSKAEVFLYQVCSSHIFAILEALFTCYQHMPYSIKNPYLMTFLNYLAQEPETSKVYPFFVT